MHSNAPSEVLQVVLGFFLRPADFWNGSMHVNDPDSGVFNLFLTRLRCRQSVYMRTLLGLYLLTILFLEREA